MSELITCPRLCSQSVSTVAVVASEEGKLQENVVAVCVSLSPSVCVPREGVGIERHLSGGAKTGPICQPKQGDWSLATLA